MECCVLCVFSAVLSTHVGFPYLQCVLSVLCCSYTLSFSVSVLCVLFITSFSSNADEWLLFTFSFFCH